MNHCCRLIAPLLLAATSVAGQGPVRLATGTDTLALWLVERGDTTRSGVVIDEVKVISHDGEPAYQRRYHGSGSLFEGRIDTMVDRVRDLAPLRSVAVRGNRAAAVRFEGGRALGEIFTVLDGVRAIDVAVPDGVVQGGSLDLALRRASLALGDTLHHRLFAPLVTMFTTTTSIVAGLDTVDGRPAWRVMTDFHDIHYTMWIDTTTRVLHRQTLEMPGGLTLLIDRRRPESGRRPPQPS